MDEEAGLRNRYWRPTAGQTVLDIGCFRGSWTLPALEAGASVHAFDTNTDALNQIRQAAKHQGLVERLMLNHTAVGRQYPRDLADQIPEAMRPAGEWVTIDDYANDLHVDWIKVDVEGGEHAVLETARTVLERDRPRLIVELHHLVYRTTDRWSVLDLLLDLGYRASIEALDGYERRPIHLIAEPKGGYQC